MLTKFREIALIYKYDYFQERVKFPSKIPIEIKSDCKSQIVTTIRTYKCPNHDFLILILSTTAMVVLIVYQKRSRKGNVTRNESRSDPTKGKLILWIPYRAHKIEPNEP